MHPSIGRGVSTDFKSSNRIKISWLVQILLHFYWFRAPHPLQGRGGYLGGWRWCGDLLDNGGMTWGWQEWHGDDGGRCGNHGDNMGTMETTWGGDNGDHSHGDLVGAMGTMWAWCGDDVGTTWGWWGQWGDHGDYVGTMKNAITFEQIVIIEFCLKIWDPWALLYTYRLHLMCRWGVSYPKWHFYAKSAQNLTKMSIFTHNR